MVCLVRDLYMYIILQMDWKHYIIMLANFSNHCYTQKCTRKYLIVLLARVP